MMQVSPAAGSFPADVSAALQAAVEADAAARKLKLQLSIFSKDVAAKKALFAFSMNGVPGFMPKIAASKAYSFLSG